VRKGTLDTKYFTRRKAPGVPFTKIAAAILSEYEISLAFVGETRARALNMSLRNKDYVPNVLSYILDKKTKSAEIIICLTIAEKQAPSYELSYKSFVVLLFIHGLLHIKGLSHGARMEKMEQEYLRKFIS